MTEAQVFATIAVLCLTGWTVALALWTRGLLPTANAFRVWQAIVSREDDKIASMIRRIEEHRNPKAAEPQPRQRIVEPEPGALGGAFAPETHSFIADQPDDEDERLEIVP